MQRYRE